MCGGNMKLFFSNENYKSKALKIKQIEKTKHSVGEAFMLLVKGVGKDDLSNLLELMQNKFKQNLSLEDCYELTQGNSRAGIEINGDLKNSIVDLAYKCIESGKTLGEKTINEGKINTSSWMSHVLYEGKLAKELAIKFGLDARYCSNTRNFT